MPKVILVKYTRKGKCNFRKCKAACCSAVNVEFGEIENDIDSNAHVSFVNNRCTNITPVFECGIYRNRPSVCGAFPESPWDLIYQQVKSKCTFWFEIEIKEVEENVSPNPNSDIDAGG